MGGATTFLINLGRELSKTGQEYLFISLSLTDNTANDFVEHGIGCSLPPHRAMIFEDRMLWALRLINNFNPTHIVACLGPESFEVLRYIPNGLKRFALVQSDDPCVYRALGSYAEVLDGVAGVSKAICKKLSLDERLSRGFIGFQPYGVESPGVKKRAMLRDRTPSDPLKIVYLGRLIHEQKRVRVFPMILERMKSSNIPFEWIIAGDGPDRTWLEAAMKTDVAHQRVVFLGALPYAGVTTVLSNSDVMLLASDYEGLPLSLLEAMHHGVVPVVSDLESGISDLVDESCGIRVTVDRIDDYSAAILRLHRDRTLLERMSVSSQTRATSLYSAKAMAQRWMDMFRANRATEARWPLKQRITHPILQPGSWYYREPIRSCRRIIRWLGFDRS